MLSFSNILLFVFPHILITIAQPNFVGHICTPNNSYTSSSTYQTNLNTAISILTSNTNITYGFYNFSYGEKPYTVHTLALCRGDVDLNSCRTCVADSAKYLRQLCSDQKEAYGWYDICMFRYANRPIYHYWDTTVPGVGYNVVDPNNASLPDQFELAVRNLMEKITPMASNGDSLQKFSTGSSAGTNNDTIYMLVQCTPDLSAQQCNNCIAASGSELGSCCSGRVGASIFKASCTLRYNTTLFYGDTPAGTPLQPPSPSPHVPLGENNRTTRTAIVIIVAVVSVLVTCISIGICIFRRKRKQKQKEKYKATEYGKNEIIRATRGFSIKNKLGQGGNGVVYKGKLKDGTRIAVKKVIDDSTRYEEALKNEVLVLEKLGHKNLVRLLGFSRDGTRILLIYEFVPKGTLDKFIYGDVRTSSFNWKTLYNIMEGIAKGLVYLHKDSGLKIIHRDIKLSNILLDEKMTPKIADFGTARLLALDATHCSTHNPIGTRGYMPPEYVYPPYHYSFKTDVYSYGIIVLEILSGKSIHSSPNPEDTEDNFLSYAWRNWETKKLSNLINSALKTDSSSLNIIQRCIQIGLLCIQQSPHARPTMTVVHEWLTDHSIDLPKPTKPAFIANGGPDHPPFPTGDETDSIQSSQA